MIEQIKSRISEIETAISQLITQHAALQGSLTEARHFLDMATKISDEIAPLNPVVEVLDIVDQVVDKISAA